MPKVQEIFELLSRYEAVSAIGKGTYGFVCSARDSEKVEFLSTAEDGDLPEELREDALAECDPDERADLLDAFTMVAIKKLKGLFEDYNNPRMWMCAIREIQLMMKFNHENVMCASDFFIPLGGLESMTFNSIRYLKQNFESVYIVMKKMDYTLREVLDSMEVTRKDIPEEVYQRLFAEEGKPELEDDEVLRDRETHLLLHPLTVDYRKFILYQIMRGLGYMHRCCVMHRDMKPENVLMDRSYKTCITDFGQGRDVSVELFMQRNKSEDVDDIMSLTQSVDNLYKAKAKIPPNDANQSYNAAYVDSIVNSAQTLLDNTSQWYAPPETLSVVVQLSSSVGYIDGASFHGIDVWSVGCIAAEMLLGRPLFATSKMGGAGQIIKIIELLGEPSEKDQADLVAHRGEESRELFVKVLQKVLVQNNLQGKTNTLRDILHSPYGDETEEEVQLIMDCLAWNPAARITIEKALQSPYFANDGYDPEVDPNETVQHVTSVRLADIEDPVTGREMLWELYAQRHPEVQELWHSLSAKHTPDGDSKE
ncbi:protein kinase [Angomonas deanei]|nr:protein kinase [Angomonas deanei]|eukprot:EPY18726.1 protein kinase [Angomonas deanei]